MPLRLIYLLIAMLPAFTAAAQRLRATVAAAYPGVTAHSRYQADAFAASANPAALVMISRFQFAVFGERRYQLAETSAYLFAMACPARYGHFGLQLQYAGFSAFGEHQAGLTYARPLGPGAAAGIQFNHYGYRVAGWGSATALGVDLGLRFALDDQLSLGLRLSNPAGGIYRKTGERLPRSFSLSAGYDASPGLFIGADLSKEQYLPVRLHAAIQYALAEQFYLRAGISTTNGTAYLGGGVRWRQLRLDVTGSQHPQLGFSPGLMLVYGGKIQDTTPRDLP